MRKHLPSLVFAVMLLLCSVFAHGQGLRWDIGQPGSAGLVTIGGTGLSPLYAEPNATLAWCYYPANAVPCTNYAPTYTSLTLATACASNTPVVLQGSSSCVATGDNFGNLGVYTAPNEACNGITCYAYTITVGGVTSGPYLWTAADAGIAPTSAAAIQAAINANCSGTVPGEVNLAVGGAVYVVPMTSAISVPSHCTVKGPGSTLLDLQAAANWSGGNALISLNGVTDSRLTGFAIDGNRANNSGVATFNGINIQGNSSFVTLEDIAVSNFGPGNTGDGFGVLIGSDAYTQSFITIADSEFSNNGEPITSSGVAYGAGIILGNGTGSVQNVDIRHNVVCGNAVGIYVANPSSASATVKNVKIDDNRVCADAGDGILIYSPYVTGGLIENTEIARNNVECVGYNGSSLPTYCTNTYGAGLLQTGAYACNSCGVGINYNATTAINGRIEGNHVGYPYWDGLDSTVQFNATVTTSSSGNTVTITAGTSVPSCWQPGQGLEIGSNLYNVATITNSTSFTLDTNPGNHTGLHAVGPECSNVIVVGNKVTHAGANNSTAYAGQGYSDIGLGDSWSSNEADHSAGVGFSDQFSFLNTHHGDIAIDNEQQSGGYTAGFLCQACTDVYYDGVQATDDQASPTQTIGVQITPNGGYNRIASPLLWATFPSGGTAVVDDGTNDNIDYMMVNPSISGCSATSFTANGFTFTYTSGTSGTCTVTVTTGITVSTGYVCSAFDKTTASDAQTQNLASATQFRITGTTVTGDVIVGSCRAL